jgi:hypothetical protein
MCTLEAIGVVFDGDSGITHVVCLAVTGEAVMYPISDIISFISNGNTLYTDVGHGRTPVYVVNGPVRRAYVRTQANESVEDNLLNLPRY